MEKPLLQIHASVILAALLTSRLTAKGDWLRGGIAFFITFTVLEAGTWWLLNWRGRNLRKEGQQFRDSLASLSLENARSRALAILATFDTISQSEPIDPRLPSTLQDVFNRYQRVVLPAGILELGPQDNGFVRVGQSLDVELFVRETDQGLFELEGSDLLAPTASAEYLSVFHWIVANTQGIA